MNCVTRLYKVDETGIQTSTNKPPKILSVKCKKQIGVILSTEQNVDKLLPIVCCYNAAGLFIRPFMIFARKMMQNRPLDGSPSQTRGTCSPDG